MEDDLVAQIPGSSGSCKKRKTKDAMKLIKTNRKGVWKELRKLQKKEQQKVKNKLSMLSFKSAVEKFQDDKSKELTRAYPDEVPVEKKNVYSKKVLQYHMQNFNRRKAEEPKKEEKTVFTDRDFDRFEEEYDNLDL
ncbi:hypothetical protein C0Q70_01124 [Pomacea canaliculata]|uniref:Uncharacterized protein n=2 Tax=Pomacea canaliculata TaxID=400727 RepID=A0A2T7PYM5_POMCA|nr:hypothetical protein C0Q70_01124 [Pomacea canaliculata]